MKKTNFLYSIVLIICVCSCRKERNMAYEGPAVIEFDNPVTGVNTKLTGQSIGGASNIGGDENIPIRGTTDSVIVQLVGVHRSEPINIQYEVVPGTAVEGTHFDILDTKGTVTIPANSSKAAIRFTVKNNSANPADIRTLSFKLKSTDKTDVGISENYASYNVSIFPMKAFLNKTLASGAGATRYFSSANGEVYTSATGNPALADIAYSSTPTPTLISPFVLSGTAGASASFFSKRVFVPAASVPPNLQYSYATLQLDAVTSTSVNAIPVSGTTATAATFSSVEVVVNGIYGFVNGNGKKGYIRVKSISSSGSITIDVMAQP
jgi:hypothetical protein